MIQIKPRDICMADAMPFNQHWEARVVGTFDEMCSEFDNKSFANIAGLRVGDQVVVVTFTNTSWSTMTGIGEFRITEIPDRRDRVEFKLMRISQVAPPGEDKAPEPELPVFVIEKVDKGWAVKEEGASKATEVFSTKKAAEEFQASLKS